MDFKHIFGDEEIVGIAVIHGRLVVATKHSLHTFVADRCGRLPWEKAKEDKIMSGDIEHGKCEICGKEADLERTYFHYPIKCECHSPNHFYLVIHCKDCTPKEPEYQRLQFKTETLNNPASIAIDILRNALTVNREPDSYYDGWKSNIACCIMDYFPNEHEKANKAAEVFLRLLIKE